MQVEMEGNALQCRASRVDDTMKYWWADFARCIIPV